MGKLPLILIGFCLYIFPVNVSGISTVGSFVSEAEKSDLLHTIGRVDGDGWSAQVSMDKAGFLSRGPYAVNFPWSSLGVTYRLMIDSIHNINDKVVTIDLYDASSNKVLTSRDIYRKEFLKPLAYQDFTINIKCPAGSKLEYRVYWQGTSYVKIDKIFVKKSDEILLLIDSQVYNLLKNEIQRYKSDVESRFAVNISVINGVWKNPDEIRALIKKEYSENRISGVVLVGALPMHRFFMHEFGNPNPLYYEAFDMAFVDSNRDGIAESYLSYKPEMMKLWIANIRVGVGVNQTDSRVEELRTFFNKTHEFYTGNQSIERRALSVCGTDSDPGTATWFSDNYAKVLFGDRGDVLERYDYTEKALNSLFTAHKYTFFRLADHSHESATDIADGELTSEEMYEIPNKALITFHLGCFAANWMKNSAGEKNNAQAWVFGKGIGQAVIGGVRSGTIYQENVLYKKLLEGNYLGKAYLACKTAGEQEMFSEYSDGSIVAGNVLIGNPFVMVAGLTEIPLPIVKPTGIINTSKTAQVRASVPSWHISTVNGKLLVESQFEGNVQIQFLNAQGEGISEMYNGDIKAGSHYLLLPTVSNGFYLLIIKNRYGKVIYKKGFTLIQ
jgi:hypothetical protein